MLNLSSMIIIYNCIGTENDFETRRDNPILPSIYYISYFNSN